MKRKQLLILLLILFIIGNALAALAPNYTILMAARIIAALTHGSFFGVGSIIASELVSKEKRARAISIMFAGLTLASSFLMFPESLVLLIYLTSEFVFILHFPCPHPLLLF